MHSKYFAVTEKSAVFSHAVCVTHSALGVGLSGVRGPIKITLSCTHTHTHTQSLTPTRNTTKKNVITVMRFERICLSFGGGGAGGDSTKQCGDGKQLHVVLRCAAYATRNVRANSVQIIAQFLRNFHAASRQFERAAERTARPNCIAAVAAAAAQPHKCTHSSSVYGCMC